MSWTQVFQSNPVSDFAKVTGFISPDTARMLGDSRFSYRLWFQLSPIDRDRARSAYPHKRVGAMYDFKDEHYYYPVTKSGVLTHARAQRVLAIPNSKIWDREYMQRLGYPEPRSGFKRK